MAVPTVQTLSLSVHSICFVFSIFLLFQELGKTSKQAALMLKMSRGRLNSGDVEKAQRENGLGRIGLF